MVFVPDESCIYLCFNIVLVCQLVHCKFIHAYSYMDKNNLKTRLKSSRKSEGLQNNMRL